MGVTVTFAVQVGSDQFVAEPDLAGLDPARLHGRDPLFGRLTVDADDQPTIVLHDDLEYLVVNVFQAIPQLVAGNPVTVWHSDSPAEFRLEPTGDQVRITGTVLPTAVVPATELLPALHECGVRFLDFVRTTLAGEADLQARLPDLEQWADEAARALRT
jgi:hypothetical protein